MESSVPTFLACGRADIPQIAGMFEAPKLLRLIDPGGKVSVARCRPSMPHRR